jgi:cell division protein FtsB
LNFNANNVKNENILLYVLFIFSGLLVAIYVGYVSFYGKYSFDVYSKLKNDKERLVVEINALKHKNAKLQKYYLHSQITQNIEDK